MHLPPLDPIHGRYPPGMFDPTMMTPGGPGPSSTPYLPAPAGLPPSNGYPDYPFDAPNQWQPYPPPPPHQAGPDFGQPWYMPGPSQPATAPMTSSSGSPYPPMRGSIHSVQSHPSPQQREEQPKKKKKRKGEDSPNSADEKEKRTKTGRACDACVSSHHNLLLMAADEKDTVRHSTLRPAYLRTLQAVQSGVYILYAHHRDAVQKEATGR